MTNETQRERALALSTERWMLLLLALSCAVIVWIAWL